MNVRAELDELGATTITPYSNLTAPLSESQHGERWVRARREPLPCAPSCPGRGDRQLVFLHDLHHSAQRSHCAGGADARELYDRYASRRCDSGILT